MKLNQLMNTRQIFSEHAQERLSVPLAYKIMKYIKSTEAEAAFYDEKLKGIIDQYAEKDENGKPVFEDNGIKVAKEHISECNNEIAELYGFEVEGMPEVTFTLKELGELKLSVSEIYNLDELIKEE